MKKKSIDLQVYTCRPEVKNLRVSNKETKWNFSISIGYRDTMGEDRMKKKKTSRKQTFFPFSFPFSIGAHIRHVLSRTDLVFKGIGLSPRTNKNARDSPYLTAHSTSFILARSFVSYSLLRPAFHSMVYSRANQIFGEVLPRGRSPPTAAFKLWRGVEKIGNSFVSIPGDFFIHAPPENQTLF